MFQDCTYLDVALYAEMREGSLADDNEFATRQIREHLKCKAKFTHIWNCT